MLHVLRKKQARVKKAILRHPSFTAVTQKRQKRKFASPVHNVLMTRHTTIVTAVSAIITS
jgi:hypothetical protein